MYSSILSLNLALDGGVGGGQRHVPPIYHPPPGKGPGTYFKGGWVGPTNGLDGREKSHPTPGFDPRTIQTVVSRYPSPLSVGQRLV